jgi:2-polyprenyl-6-methoxyphenol hydroxylase-like FAD-dependent oxidoreductase
MQHNTQTDILIIGAGPVGLMAANQLARFGSNLIIIDGKRGPTVESRAHSVSPRSMEIYQQMELSDTIISDGAVLNGFYLYSNGSKKAEVEFSVVGDGISDFSKVFYGFEQFKTEGLLSENLKKSNNEVVWNTEFVSLEETLDYVVVTVRDVNSKEESTITAKYIVGCDGGRSPVRHAGKFAFEGGEYEKKFFVADIDVEWDKGNIFDPVKVVMEPADSTFIFFFPYKDENRYRAMGSLTNELNEKKEITDQEILDVIHQSSSFKFDIK